MWDAADGECLVSLHRHGDMIWRMAFSPDGTRLASANLDRTVRVWTARQIAPVNRE